MQNIFTEMNWIKLVLLMMQHILIIKILQKEPLQINFLRDKAFNIAKDPKYGGYQRRLASMVYKFFDKKPKGSDIPVKSTPQNEQLTKELQKPIIRKFKKRKVHAAFKDHIWGADLADMRLINKCNKEVRFFLCVIDSFSKYALVVPLKDKKGASIVAAFQSILKQSNRKPNKIWVDKGSEFYNTFFKKWLQAMILLCIQHIMNENLLRR